MYYVLLRSPPFALRPLVISRRIPFDRLPGFPRLFQRYAAGDPEALEFFEYDWRDDAAFDLAAERTIGIERDRSTLASILSEQNARWGNDSAEVIAHIESLKRFDSTMVVTGQQLGLFGGPLYTIYKAVIAIQLAGRLSQQTGRSVVPVFWLADEDHDWEEVRSATVVHRDATLTVELHADDSREPVGRRVLDDQATSVIDRLENVLPRTEHTAGVLDALRSSYRPGTSHRDAFARWIATLFRGTGMVLISADDARFKRLATPVFQREIAEPSATLEALYDAGHALDAAGFHQQVTPLAGNLFLMGRNGRLPLDPQSNDAYAVRGTDRLFHTDELEKLLADEPASFSPNVVLRPVMEDALLPVVAYVGGPGEISYYAQLRGVYDRFGVPMPVVYPRASVTLLEPRVKRVLERHDLDMEDFDDGSEAVLEALHRRLALALDRNGVEEAFAEARARLHEAAETVRPPVESVDPTLGRSTESVRVRLLQDLESLERKVVRAQKRAHGEIRAQLDRAAAHLVPGGVLQERGLSAVHFVNRLGLDFTRHLIATLSLDTSEHQLVEV